MKLAEYQRAVLRASLAEEPSEELLAQLGDPVRFRLYRHMIRTRLRSMAQVAFRRSLQVVGSAAFAAAFDRFLRHEPPRSPLIREVIARFGELAMGDAQLLSAGPSYLADLLRFERTKWCLAYAPCTRPKFGEQGVRELDFDGVPVWNPVFEQLSLSHAVHTLEEPASDLPHAPRTLFVYRPEGSDEVRWYEPDRLFAEVVRVAKYNEQPLTETVKQAASQLGRELNHELLEELATSITWAVQRGVLVGVR